MSESVKSIVRINTLDQMEEKVTSYTYIFKTSLSTKLTSSLELDFTPTPCSIYLKLIVACFCKIISEILSR